MDTITNDQIERPEWLDHSVFPLTLRRMDLPSGSVAYTDEGEGPTLLFVHAGMWSFVFRDVITRLRAHFRCVTLDFPGSGLSPRSEQVDGLEGLAGLLGEFVVTLDLKDVTLVAHDLGGLVGAAAAGSDRDRYAGLVLVNTFAWTPDSTALRGMLRLMGGATMTALDVATNLVPRMTSTRFGAGRHLDGGSRQAFLGPFRDRGPRRRFHRLMRSAVSDSEFTDRVATLAGTTLADLPVLSIYGEKNDPFGFQDRVAATWTDHEGIVIEKGNHFPMCDAPDLVAATVTDWHRRKIG